MMRSTSPTLTAAPAETPASASAELYVEEAAPRSEVVATRPLSAEAIQARIDAFFDGVESFLAVDPDQRRAA
jgi:hypothetical protein